jgi:predicted metalloprotease with PDZ domain
MGVAENTPADDAGTLAGDLILQMNGVQRDAMRFSYRNLRPYDRVWIPRSSFNVMEWSGV